MPNSWLTSMSNQSVWTQASARKILDIKRQ